MKRRSFIKKVSAGAAGVATAGIAAPAISQNLREWRMVTSWPANFPGLGTGAQRLADRITAMSDGRLTVRVFSAGELVPPLGTFDAVEQGTAECSHSAAYYYQGKSRAVNFFTAVPFGMVATEHNAWIRHGGGQELWDELYDGFGMKGFLCGNTGTQMGGWFRNEINSIDDLRGLNFRTAGLGGEVFRRLGTNVQTLPGGEIFAALQAGTIDAAEWVGPWNDLAFGFHRIASNYYWPSATEPSAALEFAVNKRAWDELPSDLQAVVTSATAAETEAMTSEFAANNIDALNTLINEHGVQLREFSRDMLIAMGQASAEVVAELRDEGGITQRVYESYMDFRRKSIAGTRTAEQGYLNARLLPFEYGT